MAVDLVYMALEEVGCQILTVIGGCTTLFNKWPVWLSGCLWIHIGDLFDAHESLALAGWLPHCE